MRKIFIGLLQALLIISLGLAFMGLIYSLMLIGKGETETRLTEKSLVKAVNDVRITLGVEPLNISPLLGLSAKDSAAKIVKSGVFEHYGKTEASVADIIWSNKYPKVYEGKPVYVGENLACGYSDPLKLVDDWMTSETHRFNLTYPKYRETAVAIDEFQSAEGLRCLLVVMQYGTASSTLK